MPAYESPEPLTERPTARAVAAAAPAVSALGLRKSYGDKVVLDGIDLDIPEGTVFALLGPNGAGKTTTVEILTTLVAPDAGEARVAGHDLARRPEGVRAAIGVTGQFAAVDHLLTAEENLLLMADLHHLPRPEGRRRAAGLLRRFELSEAARMPASALSGGMRRKLDLAMTLVGDPRILFLDEPTTGLDPRSRRTMWEIIRGLVADDGITVFLTTQYLEEADRLADRIAVLDQGRLVAEGTADELKRLIPGGHIRLRFPDLAALDGAARHFAAAARDPEELTLRVPGDGGIPALRAVLAVLDGAGLRAESLTVHTPDLDDVFLTLTGRGTPGTTTEMTR
ncbi:ATP-binding cassette domain-containing protein [Streptomyces sp. NPDC006464]|uniref:ATP-binding cassette domain-containing protein n=1 Tax=Streptomyces sp. NPDC006464 TaxID=3154305 RepID=UPI0033A10067